MKLKVIRFSSQQDSTSGILMEDTDMGLKFLCYTLEDERRALKVKGETRVPAGIYNIISSNISLGSNGLNSSISVPSLNIEEDLEKEELIRKVGKEINEQINSYKTKMNIDDPQDLLAMVAFDSFIKLSNQNKSPIESNKILEQLKEMNRSVENNL